jgi:hypothetical protein
MIFDEPLTLEQYISYMQTQLELFKERSISYQKNGELPEVLPLPDWHEQFDMFEEE